MEISLNVKRKFIIILLIRFAKKKGDSVRTDKGKWREA